jgi:hypothetical protein
VSRPRARLFSRVALAAFSDLAHGFQRDADLPPDARIRFLGDAGIGLRAEHRIGDTRFVTRFDLPLWVSRPELAQDRSAADDELAFRWVFSFEPALLDGASVIPSAAPSSRAQRGTFSPILELDHGQDRRARSLAALGMTGLRS